MKLGEWCAKAQIDQNLHHVSHLYANYRQSRTNMLITSRGLDSFTAAVSFLDLQNETDHFSVSDPSKRDGGLANFITKRSEQLFYQSFILPAVRPPTDFRLDGQEIPYPNDSIFLNLAREEIAIQPGASGVSSRRLSPPPANLARIVWLTRPNNFLRKLKNIAVRRNISFDERRFFAELTGLLGLKHGRVASTLYRIDLYRIRAGQTLHRPHALSMGYPDRFCGKSDFEHFGSTVDNRSGKSGLPEGIILASSTEKLETTDPAYVNLKRRLTRIAPWINVRSVKPIEARLSTDDVHVNDLPYYELQPMILSRLNEKRDNCNSWSSPACVCTSVAAPGQTP